MHLKHKNETISELAKLLATPEPPDLGPGPRPGVLPEAALRRALAGILRQSQVSQEKQELIRALVLLWHDHLDPAHGIAQSVDNADGAFVHGIMHRREPDYANAKYWFRRVGQHPAFPEIASRVASLQQVPQGKEVPTLVQSAARWDAFAMIDACEHAAASGPADPLACFLRQVQRIETQVLLGWLANHSL